MCFWVTFLKQIYTLRTLFSLAVALLGEAEADLTILHHQQMQHDCKERATLLCKQTTVLVNLFLYSVVVSNLNFIMCNPDIAVPYHCTLLIFLYTGLKFYFSLSVRGEQSCDMMHGKYHWNFFMDCYEFRNQIQPVSEA